MFTRYGIGPSTRRTLRSRWSGKSCDELALRDIQGQQRECIAPPVISRTMKDLRRACPLNVALRDTDPVPLRQIGPIQSKITLEREVVR
jgi:hypothetical protein